MATPAPQIFAKLLPLRRGRVRSAVQPIGRIRFFYRSGTMRSSREGTAFFVEGWNRTVLTAAHNVFTDEGEHALRVQLTFPSAEQGKGPTVVFARAYAYPEPYSLHRDVAVVLLPMELGVRSAPKYGRAPEGAFAGVVAGFPVSGHGFTLERSPVSAQSAGAFLDYVSGQTEGGESGAPLLWNAADQAEHAVGIHIKRAGAASAARSWAHDDALIEACLKSARGIIPLQGPT